MSKLLNIYLQHLLHFLWTTSQGPAIGHCCSFPSVTFSYFIFFSHKHFPNKHSAMWNPVVAMNTHAHTRAHIPTNLGPHKHSHVSPSCSSSTNAFLHGFCLNHSKERWEQSALGPSFQSLGPDLFFDTSQFYLQDFF